MKVLKKILLALLAIYIVFLIPSLLYMASTYGANSSFRDDKLKLKSTNLSSFLIDGHGVGVPIGKLNYGTFATGVDGKKYVSLESTKDKYVDIEAVQVTGNLYDQERVTVSYNGQLLRTKEEVVKALGDNYIKRNIKHESTEPSTIYRDQKNQLELRIYYYGVELSKAEQPLMLPDFDQHDSYLALFIAFPGSAISMILFTSRLGMCFTVVDHIFIPLCFAIMALPAVCCFVIKKKKLTVITVLGYIVFSLVQVAMLIRMASMM